MIKFNCRKSLYMKSRPILFNFFNKRSPIMKIVRRMYTTDDMNFSNSLIVKTLHNVKHLFMAVFPAFRITFRFVVRTEPAIINTLIGWLNVKIAVEICKIAVVSPSDNSCKQTERCQIGFFKKEQTICRRYTDIVSYLIRYSPEFFIVYMA